MIGALEGMVEILNPNEIIVWVNQMGYQVLVPVNLKLSQKDKVKLYIHTYVKEDALVLYGFDTKDKLNLFKAFLQVSGIGPKLAL